MKRPKPKNPAGERSDDQPRGEREKETECKGDADNGEPRSDQENEKRARKYAVEEERAAGFPGGKVHSQEQGNAPD